MKKNRVDIYTRLSDEDRYKRNKNDDSESIANQKSMLLKYALEQGWEVINVYSDDDFSGTDRNRPQFKKLLKDCENGVVDIVLCKTQSRFSRDMEIIEKYIHNKFIEWKVRFVSIVDNADTENKGNKKSRQINGLINEWYLEDLSDNIKKSLQNRREDGLYLGSFAPYGYMKDPNNKNKLIIDPVAAKVVKEIFDLYKSGVGYYKIAMILNNRGVLTPTNYKKENGSKFFCANVNFNGKALWSQHTIANILKKEVYIGNLVQGVSTYVSYKNHKKYKKPKEEWTYAYGTHEPIIDMETWNIVQNKIKKRIRISKFTGEVYMLSQKVYCKECGSIFTRQLYHTKEGKVPYLKCKSRKLASRDCVNVNSIRCEKIEKVILDELNKQLDLYYNIDELQRLYVLQKKSLGDDSLFKSEALNTEKKALEEKIDKKNEHYRLLYEDKLEGTISSKDFILFRDKIKKEIDNYQNRILIINKELEKINSKSKIIKTSKKIFEKYKHIDKLTREIVDEFVDIVYIGKINKEDNSRDIDIHLNIINLN